MLSNSFDKVLNDVLQTVRGIEGFLTDREVRFLFLLGACPTAEGEVLEIGSFKGKSTIVLTKAVLYSGFNKIIAVDPLTSPSITDPDLKGVASAFNDFRKNLKKAGILNNVEFYQMFSHELEKGWNRKIRLLWIDGDHTCAGAKKDFEMFSKFLSDGAIVAFHDVLGCDGPLKVFMDDILLSNRFGPTGLCGTIGWAQYIVDNKKITKRFSLKKLRLYLSLKLLWLFDFSISSSGRNNFSLFKDVSGGKWRSLKKLNHNIWRSIVPHREISPKKWLNEIMQLKRDTFPTQ